MAFFPITASHFDKQFSKLARKNAVFKVQAAKKIKGIALNPEIGAPKTHKLKGLRSLHISDHFVVVYMIFRRSCYLYSEPQNKLTSEEKRSVIQLVNRPEYRDLSPHQIVPRLADQGTYLASESSIYRILRAENLLCHRGKAKPRTGSRPKPYEAIRPNQIYSWDITYLMSSVRGQYFYLYLFLDVYSRKIVGWEVHNENPQIFLRHYL